MEKNQLLPLVAGNWKMHKTPEEARRFAASLKAELRGLKGAEVVVCPPFPALPVVAEVLVGSGIGLGAQNMHWAAEGAFTGEVSPVMLRAVGCSYVILGHSERRSWFGESDEVIRRKLEAALNFGLRPIFCLGEDLAAREEGRAAEVCLAQLRAGVSGLPWREPGDLVIAYEPVWAIGTGRTATPGDAAAVVRLLREELARLYGREFAARVRFLYGGSVNPGNVAGFYAEEEISGVLAGGASLDVESFVALVRLAAKIKAGVT